MRKDPKIVGDRIGMQSRASVAMFYGLGSPHRHVHLSAPAPIGEGCSYIQLIAPALTCAENTVACTLRYTHARTSVTLSIGASSNV